MLCDICHKNEATIHIQEFVNGQRKSMHLCSSCAAARQEQDGLEFGPFNLAGMLYKLAGNAAGEAADNESAVSKPENMLKCPVCNWDSARLSATGELGCGNCYKVFAGELAGELKNMHRGVVHLGKHPAGKGSEQSRLHSELIKLQKNLNEAIEVEAYEEAALLRDRISEIKQQYENCSKSQQEGCNE